MAENEKDLEKDAKPEAKTDADADAESTEEHPKKKKSNILIIAVLVLVVVIAGLVGFLVLQSGDDEEPKEKTKKEEVIAPPVFYSLKELVVSLSGNTSNIRYLKLVLDFELEKAEDQAVVEQLQPKIVDEYQTYLRQLRLEDLRGSVGTYRLKESLLLRANQVVQPVQVKNVLIKEMLIQ
ncbi:MAG: flagellar basal body protein FliL [Alphaproteobacteria bacterium]|nr:flagellar basal body protein FliL [Alphaproteobacteria bacterium]